MKVDALLRIANLKDIPHAAKAAEEIGLDGIWMGETAHEPLLAMPLIAEHTARVQLGTSVTIAFARSPMILAYAAWDLAVQSNGRFILGLGTQVKTHVERRFGMPWDAPARKLRETVLAIRAIWRNWQHGEDLNFRGQYYKHTLMTPFFSPGPIAHPDVPIFIAGVNPGLCQLAGEVADGFHIHPFHSKKYLQEVILPAIDTGAAKAGRSRRDLELSSMIFTITSDEQREQHRAQLAFYASTPSYRAVLELHGWSEVGERLSRLAARGRWDEMPKEITDEMIEEFAVVAAPQDLPAKLLDKYQGLLDRIALYEPLEPGQNDAQYASIVAESRSRG